MQYTLGFSRAWFSQSELRVVCAWQDDPDGVQIRMTSSSLRFYRGIEAQCKTPACKLFASPWTHVATTW